MEAMYTGTADLVIPEPQIVFLIAFRVSLKWILSFLFGCGCGLIFGAGLGFSWWLAGVFLFALVGFTAKLKNVTDDNRWVVPLWIGSAVGAVVWFALARAAGGLFR